MNAWVRKLSRRFPFDRRAGGLPTERDSFDPFPLVVAVVSILFALPMGADHLHAQMRNQTVDPALFEGLDYRMVGPSRGGAVTAVAGHASHPLTFYLGVRGGGGIWKTENYGQTWYPVSDGFIKTSSTIGSIRVAPSDPDIVYAGTGTDGIRSNVIRGRGIYRSTDAGETWELLGLEEAGQMGRMVVHPEDPDRVFVGAMGSPFGKNPERGVFRTTDGGNSWEKVLFISDSVGVYGLEMAPDEPETLYASGYRGERKPWTIISGCDGCGDGIYKSTDGGDSWNQVTDGLPGGLIGKIDLAVTPADPDRVYALVEAAEDEEGLYRSDDRGDTWSFVSGGRYPEDDPEGLYELTERPFYYTNVHADPQDPDVVWVNNERFFKSVDGGRSWEIVPTPHGDNHDMWINPDNTDIFIQSNDGGANVTLDGGKTWSTQHNQPTAELYQVDVDTRFPYFLYAGQQDNSTIAVPSLPPAEPAPAGPESWWKAVGGCETGPAVPNPADPTSVYAPCKGTFDRFSYLTGQAQGRYVGGQYLYGVNPEKLQYRLQRTTPVEVSPHNPNIVYHGSQYVHRTMDEGLTWERISPDLTANPPERQMRSGTPITNDITGEEHFSVIYVIEESELQPGVIWTGANDGPVHVTRDGGETWTDVTPPDWAVEGRINAIEPSSHARGTAYVTGYRYLLNDFHPYVFKTTDYGESWTLLTDGTNGIPSDYPVRVVREDPERPGLLYAGTEFGMFISFDDGAHWQSFQIDLPRTPITDIEVVHGDLAISTMGRSFWILDNVTPLRQIDEQVVSAEAHLFEPRDAHRMRYRATAGGGGKDPHEPDYVEPGAMIDYYFANEPSGEVTLEILDSSGRVIRGFSSQSDGYEHTQRQDMRAPYVNREGQPQLDKSAGMHRFIWDLRHSGPYSAVVATGLYGRPSSRGPLVAPGAYQVRVSVGDWSQTRSFEVRIDPRAVEDGTSVTDLVAQEELNLEIRDALAEAGHTAEELHSLREDVDGGQGASRVEQLWDELVTNRTGSYPEPMLYDQIDYLYGMTTKGDGRPSQDAYTRFEELKSQLDDFLSRFNQLKPVAEDDGGAGPQ